MNNLTKLALSFFVLIQIAFADADSISFEYETLKPEAMHPRVSQVVTHVLARKHYKHQDINDSLSSNVFDTYIESLDRHKLYFLKSDIDQFKKYRYSFDDALRTGDLNTAYAIFNKFLERFMERQRYIFQRLDQPFDFSLVEFHRIDRSASPWAKTTAQLDSIWRKRLKHEALNLKLADKDQDEIAQKLKKRYKNWLRRIQQTESEDVFQVYMNALSQVFDPHTSYMSPKTSDDFKIRMSHSLEGIGASLRTEDEYTKVVEIIPGGPADKSDLLHANDRITAVGQGDDGELMDVVGWRIDDVVELIRGPKSTKVRLQIIPAEGGLGAAQDTIEIIRDKVKLSDRAATSDTLQMDHNGKTYKLGVINIPDFYFDYEAKRNGDPNYASTTRDVSRILEELKGAGVEGIIIDLRNNGGGFLNEAIDLTGLFIEEGPVVQVRDMTGRIFHERDTDPRVFYDGPLVVLVNRFSASASEIFAAAIQDYGRGIVLGSQTFGKGTVQNIERLKKYFPRSSEKLGQLKLTVAKFYRINGGSTQHVGVTPDIAFPTRFTADEVGESAQPNALLYDEIDRANYEIYNSAKQAVPRLSIQHEARVATDKEFQFLLEEIEDYESRKDRELLSLNEEVRKKERELREARKKEREKLLKDKKDEPDLFVTESAHILSDFIILSDELKQAKYSD